MMNQVNFGGMVDNIAMVAMLDRSNGRKSATLHLKGVAEKSFFF
jgi:hypothetical protein